ncbi:MAG: bifunctional folylpolyglutamate synthase/dihydrofolate synthase [Deltaproteobacteria bacterium]|nr:bifunctional folylpolyglutamate synthase/dihydrofolate synthase [Deltaproteobacteria bacterium]
MNPRLEIESFLERIAHKDFRQTLEPMREACQLLGNPQSDFTVVHIAGTNGKGSTAAFLNAILQRAGYSVGLITSPHLIDVTERIQINRQPVSWEALWEIIAKIRNTLPEDDFLSYFEMMTLAGFEYFSQMGVDIAVVETGMGGRLDATNVVTPQAAVLTSISHDHEKYLGETLMQIAQEKCGILKRDCQVISAPQSEEVAFVIEEHCRELGLELSWADPEKITFALGLKGEHQKINAACALTAGQVLLADDLIAEVAEAALRKAAWPGRLQYLRDNFLVDCAHNLGGMRTLADYLQAAHAGQKIHFLLGALADKNWQTMFEPIIPLANRFTCVTPTSGRALPAASLAEYLKRYEKPATCLERLTLPEAEPEELLVATGSLYMIGELLRCFPKPD